MMLRFVIAALCVFGPSICTAHGGSINGEATYIRFSVPGALGTYPLGINASMEITGYYTVSSTVTRGFLREADGTITTFDIAGGVRTEPEGINAAGDITGAYSPQSGPVQGFIRYADGRTVTIAGKPGTYQSVFPVAINDFDDIAISEFFEGVFTSLMRSRTGALTTLPGVPTAINDSGSVIGILGDQYGFTGFVAHPDGYSALIGPVATSYCGDQTIPDAINAAGVMAGTFTQNYLSTSSCPQNTGGFVMSPSGEFTQFQPPGQMPYFHDLDLIPGSYPLHLVSIDQAGDIAGSYIDGTGAWHGFVRNPYGTISSFDPPESGWTTVTSINDGGAIAGYYQSDTEGTAPAMGFIRVPQ
jgi:hypothetical protein